MLLAVLNKAQQKFAVRVYGLCLMANHLHLLLKPEDAKDLPRLMHWFAWYSAMALKAHARMKLREIKVLIGHLTHVFSSVSSA